jgi:hypothetical protein
MKSKEAIRNQILSYTNQIWGTKKVERLDALVQLMVSTLTNELYLIQNKLNDTDTVLLEQIARKITPEKYVSVRPAHTILQMRPSNHSTIMLNQHNTFTHIRVNEGFAEQELENILFSPITDFSLYNAKIDNLLHFKQLYSVDDYGKKQFVSGLNGQARANYVWLGLDIDPQVKNLKGLSFYLDFPGLSEIHDLYDMLPYTECFINGRKIRLKQGLPAHKQHLSESDSDILRYYNDRYLTIDEDVDTDRWKAETIPKAPESIITPEQAEELKPQYWINFVFSPYFTADMLQEMDIVVNAFPVSNYRVMQTSISKDNLSRTTMLVAGREEKLLSIDSITDDKGNHFKSDVSVGHNDAGTYHLETVNDVSIEELGLVDYIEHLLDLMEEERSVFSDINKEKVVQALSALTGSSDKEEQKIEINRKNKGAAASYLSIGPYQDTEAVNVQYRVTYGEYINRIPAGKKFTSDKSPKLNGLSATSICEIHGAKDFADIQDVMSVNSYILTSKDRIVTEHNIKSFCESELGRAVEKVEIELGGKKSPKPKEGLVKVLNINLIPSKENPESLCQKGVLKSLKTRLQQRSPDDYRYEIKIASPKS